MGTGNDWVIWTNFFTCDPQPGSDNILLLSTPPAVASGTCDLSSHTGSYAQSTQLDALR